MGKSVLDASVNNEIFRKDWANIIAMRRDLASLQGARMVLDSSGYLAGQVVARKTSDKLFYKWSAISGGTYDTVAVLFEDLSAADQSATGGDLARIITKGMVYKDKLIEYVAGSKTALVAKEITGADDVTVVSF